MSERDKVYLEMLQRRYHNDNNYYNLVNVCLDTYQNTGTFPRRLITGNAFNDLVDGRMFSDAVTLAEFIINGSQ